MIKNVRILTIIICALFINLMSINAASTCANSTKKELSQIANHIKIDYEIKDYSEEKNLEVDGNSTTYLVPNFAFEISIYNMTDDIFIEVKKSNDEETQTIYNSNATDGIYTFTDDDFGNIYNYEFTIKSNRDDCQDTIIRTTKFTKPRYNAYSEFAYCQNSSNFYCQKFIGTEINVANVDDFLSKIKVNNEKNVPTQEQESEPETIGAYFMSNWKLYVLIFVAVLVLFIGVLLFIRLRKKRGADL